MKNIHYWLMWVNIVFLVLNAGLMYIVEEPVVNFVCALVSLVGLMSSWLVYKKTSECNE